MTTRTPIHWQRLLPLAVAALAALLPGCSGDGNFTIPYLNYTTASNYDRSIRTVRVPVFENRTYLSTASSYQGIEFDVTQALVDAIESRTPYKVVQGNYPADTELTGRIVGFNKYNLLPGSTNEIRVGQAVLTAEIIWRDLRTGTILSRPTPLANLPLPDGVPDVPGPTTGRIPPVNTPPTLPPTAVTGTDPNASPAVPDGAAPPVPPIPGAPLPPGVKPPRPMPTLVRAQANFIPELGQSLGSANFEVARRMAVEIVGMMEKPW
jgi:hypothetical protein